MKAAADTEKKSGPKLTAVKLDEQSRQKTHAKILATLQRDLFSISSMMDGMWDGLDRVSFDLDPESVKTLLSVLEGLMTTALRKSEEDAKALASEATS